jgi:hypothetical protein
MAPGGTSWKGLHRRLAACDAAGILERAEALFSFMVILASGGAQSSRPRFAGTICYLAVREFAPCRIGFVFAKTPCGGLLHSSPRHAMNIREGQLGSFSRKCVARGWPHRAFMYIREGKLASFSHILCLSPRVPPQARSARA